MKVKSDIPATSKETACTTFKHNPPAKERKLILKKNEQVKLSIEATKNKYSLNIF